MSFLDCGAVKAEPAAFPGPSPCLAAQTGTQLEAWHPWLRHLQPSGLTPPAGTLVYTNVQNEEIWQILRDGKYQQLRPIEQTRLGTARKK
jgi:hypothetical protein